MRNFKFSPRQLHTLFHSSFTTDYANACKYSVQHAIILKTNLFITIIFNGNKLVMDITMIKKGHKDDL